MPNTYWIIGFATLALFFGTAFWAVLRNQSESVGSRLLFLLSIALVLLAWRWPYVVVTHEYSPDESQQIAGAITLTKDPVFWRSVDGHTAGPVNFYLLTWPKWFGHQIHYPSTRFMGLLLIFIGLVATYRSIRYAVENDAVARVSIIPLTLFFALTTNREFLHFSTEHVPICLLAVAAWAALRCWNLPRHKTVAYCALLGGLAAGTAPWAKLQSGPLSAAVVAAFVTFACIRQFNTDPARRKAAATFALASLIPSVFFFSLALATGQLDILLESYVRSNAGYVQQGLPILFSIRLYVELLAEDVGYPATFVICSLTLLAGLCVWAVRPPRRLPLPLATAALLVAIFVILAPRRSFPHYLLFSILPLGACAAVGLKEIVTTESLRRFQRAILIVFAVIAGSWIVTERIQQPRPFSIGTMNMLTSRPQTDIAHEIARYVRPGDTLGMWGWFPQYYVETQLPQAARDAHTQRAIEPTPAQGRIRDRYLSDLEHSYPPVFVDAVGERAFGYQDRKRFAHEIFPELRAWVRRHYAEVKDFGNARVYVRKDRLSAFSRGTD